MCKYCDSDFFNEYFQPYKYPRDNVVIYDHYIHKIDNFISDPDELKNKDFNELLHMPRSEVWSLQTNIRFANKFNHNKRTNIELETPINYCPWCGRKLESPDSSN